MTTNTYRSLEAIQADLDNTTTGLAAARADVELLKRLSEAEQLVKSLESKERKLIAEQGNAQAAIEEAGNEARRKAVQINDVQDRSAGESVLRSTFVTHYTKLEWNPALGKSIPAKHEASGFGSLPQDVMDSLLDFYPQMLPAKIVALHPNGGGKASLNAEEAREAMGWYFHHLARGYIPAGGTSE